MIKLSFKPRIGFTIFCLSFFILFCVLGVWQLHRYQHKKTMLVTFQERSSTPKSFLQLSHFIDALQFQRVTVEGEYVNEMTMFVQNKIYKGQVGYEVLTPLRIKNQKLMLLVDRGWIQQPADKSLPKIENINQEQQIEGYIKLLNEYQFILGNNILEPARSPLVMQKINIDDISKITHQTYYPFVLRLDASQKNGFVRDWVITSVEPERHLGYAIQWFVMAIVLMIAYFCFCCERVKENHAN